MQTKLYMILSEVKIPQGSVVRECEDPTYVLSKTISDNFHQFCEVMKAIANHICDERMFNHIFCRKYLKLIFALTGYYIKLLVIVFEDNCHVESIEIGKHCNISVF